MKADCHRFVHQHDEEFEEVKKARRPGRPPSAREDILRMRVEALQKEQKDGFCKKLSCLDDSQDLQLQTCLISQVRRTRNYSTDGRVNGHFCQISPG